MIRYVALLLSLLSLTTVAQAQTSVGAPGLNCVQPTAVGNGTADDTVALQNAFNLASTGWRAVCLQPGRYKFTSDLTLPSRVSVYGLTESFNFGVELLPTSGARLVIDGAPLPGSWHVRSTLSNLVFTLSASQASAIHINQAYHLTFDHVAIYGAHYATTAALNIASVNSFVCDLCVVWGDHGLRTGTGIKINGSDAVIQMNSPNIEGTNVGVSVTGGVRLTMVEPWFEKNNTSYSHNTVFGAGSTRILGGIISLPTGGVASVGVDVQGDHVFVQGTSFRNLTGLAYGFALPATHYSDVKLLGIPEVSSPNIFKPAANRMGVQVDPPPPSRLYPGRIHFVKQLTSGTPTDILRLSSFTSFGRFRLTLTSWAGNGFQTKQYDFGVTSNTQIGNTPGLDPIVTNLSTYSNANWQLALTNLQLVTSGSDLLVRVTATSAGVLGVSNPPTVVGELEILNYEPFAASGEVKLL